MNNDYSDNYAPIQLDGRLRPSKLQMAYKSHQHLQSMKHRRTIRDFAEKKIPYSVIKNCIRVASLAPSGANHQPWHFSAISDKKKKLEIRRAAEKEETRFYNDMKNEEWLKALKPLGTDSEKLHLERAPWLIVVFAERYGQRANGTKYKNFYVPESVGIATGFLITALHLAGLYCLVHTPNPMRFLAKICKRPLSNKATLILAVGHPEKTATIPKAATLKKSLKEVLSTFK